MTGHVSKASDPLRAASGPVRHPFDQRQEFEFSMYFLQKHQ